MFLEKLWVRLRGELIAFRDDMRSEKDLREKAEALLERVEKRLSGVSREGDERSEARSEVQEPDIQSLHQIQGEWEELRSRRERKHDHSEEAEPPPPNPRRLG
ncbi:MAG: hypothetical protein AB1733_02035 [Thermodesulfobacteriota bacterium]